MGLYDGGINVGMPIDAKKALGAVVIVIVLVVIVWLFLFVSDLFRPMALTSVLSNNPLKETEQNSVLDVTIVNITGKIAKNVEIVVQAEDSSSILIDADEIAKKKIEVVKGGRVAEEKVSPERRHISSLAQNEVRELCRIALIVEDILGVSQDIEWAIVEGKSFVLQARPLTTIDPTDAREREDDEDKHEICPGSQP